MLLPRDGWRILGVFFTVCQFHEYFLLLRFLNNKGFLEVLDNSLITSSICWSVSREDSPTSLLSTSSIVCASCKACDWQDGKTSYLWQMPARIYDKCLFVFMTNACSYLWQMPVPIYDKCLFVFMTNACSYEDLRLPLCCVLRVTELLNYQSQVFHFKKSIGIII